MNRIDPQHSGIEVVNYEFQAHHHQQLTPIRKANLLEL